MRKAEPMTIQDSASDGPVRRTASDERRRPAPESASAEVAGADRELIPDIVIRRLPIYVRTLGDLLQRGVVSISSDELADLIGVTAAQIRRDLSYFGKFGKQGKGYGVAYLSGEIRHILGLDRQWEVALVGYGNLGRAIMLHGGFMPTTFKIVAIFDRQDAVGEVVNGLVVRDAAEIERVVRELGIRIGIVAVPPDAAQPVADCLVAGGVRAILNYAPVVLKTPPDVTVRDVDPIGAMQSMTYYLDR